MIKIKISDDVITLEGHAGYAEIGKDIVCSAVSILIYTLLQYADDKGIKCRYTLDNGSAEIHITDSCRDFMITGFRLLEEAYPNYIAIG